VPQVSAVALAKSQKAKFSRAQHQPSEPAQSVSHNHSAKFIKFGCSPVDCALLSI